MFTRIALPILAVVAMLLVGCQAQPKTAQEQADVRTSADALLSSVQKTPLIQAYINSSTAYAVFPSVGEGGFIIAGGYGKGVLYEHKVITGYCDTSSGSIGATIGGQSYSEIIFFENEFALSKFKSGSFSLDAKVNAVAMDAAATKATYTNGIAVVLTDHSGLMAQASVGGQKFRFTPIAK